MKALKLVMAFVVTVATVILFGVAAAPSASAAPQTGSVTTSISDQLPTGYEGTVTVTDFANQGGDLVASGTATVTNVATGATDTQTFEAVQVAEANGSCEILDLVLGPLDLDLLGLVVQLDQVHLNITAEQGPGNLLGNLLCAVAGILDGPSPLGAIAGLLNRILGILG